MANPQTPPAAYRPRRKQAPLRSCGQCARSFRSWSENSLCGRCTEDGARRPRTAARRSAQMSELAGESWEDAFGGGCVVDESAGVRDQLVLDTG